MAEPKVNKTNPFVNPFEQGVTYEMFLAAMDKTSIEEFCKGHLTDEQINWLKEDLTHYKK